MKEDERERERRWGTGRSLGEDHASFPESANLVSQLVLQTPIPHPVSSVYSCIVTFTLVASYLSYYFFESSFVSQYCLEVKLKAHLIMQVQG